MTTTSPRADYIPYDPKKLYLAVNEDGALYSTLVGVAGSGNLIPVKFANTAVLETLFKAWARETNTEASAPIDPQTFPIKDHDRGVLVLKTPEGIGVESEALPGYLHEAHPGLKESFAGVFKDTEKAWECVLWRLGIKA